MCVAPAGFLGPPSENGRADNRTDADLGGLESQCRRPLSSPDYIIGDREEGLNLALRYSRYLGARTIQSKLRRHIELPLG